MSQAKHGTGMRGWRQAVQGGWNRMSKRRGSDSTGTIARSEGNAPQLPITRAKSLKGGKSKLTPLHPHTLSRIPQQLHSARVNPSTGPGEAAAEGSAGRGSLGAGAPPPPFRMPQPPTASPCPGA